MASFDPQTFGFDEPPPRPTTPPVRRGFLLVLGSLSLVASLVYGVPYIADEIGFAYEAGRARAASDALKKLDKAEAIDKASALFRLATNAVAPAVVNVRNVGGPSGELANLGSGVIIDKDNGYIVTNNHVVKDADRIVVRLSRGGDIAATLIGADPKTDLAVLQIPGPLRSEAQWGNSDKANVGDWVLAIGSPFALDRTVTAGIISATGRNNIRPIMEGGYEDFLQTDAAINPGNSGGPLVDMRGTVIGINTAIYSETGGNLGIGLAIPSALASSVVDQLIKNRRVVRGYLGVVFQPLNPEQNERLGVPDSAGGVLVSEVQAGGPADRAGLRANDVIVGMAGKPVEDLLTLRTRIAMLPVGTKVPLDVYRDGKKTEVEATLGEYPSLTDLGMTLRELSEEEKKALGDSGGLLITEVRAGSPADAAGIKPGMRIVGVRGRPFRNRAEYDRMIAQYDFLQGVPLVIRLPENRDVPVVIGGFRPRVQRR